ncbi:MAG: hypothetical protein NVS3B1_23640 [Marmoricola sp.]
MVAVGVVTCNRPEFCARVLEAVEGLRGVDATYVHNDGSDPKHRDGYWSAYGESTATVCHDPVNRGVAKAKNALLRAMLEDGADWLFLVEDDILPQAEAIWHYLEACQRSGFQHLSFAHHGPANDGPPLDVNGPVTCWPNYVGAFTVYGREALEKVGLMDEGFTNAWEHVEHTLRLARAGFTDPRPWHAADATGSEDLVHEISSSPKDSVICPRPDWRENIEAGRKHWRASSPNTYQMLWGDA